MSNNTTNKKKLELKKTAIANLTLSEAKMKMVIGGIAQKQSGDQYCYGVDTDNCTRDVGYTNCTGDIAKNTK